MSYTWCMYRVYIRYVRYVQDIYENRLLISSSRCPLPTFCLLRFVNFNTLLALATGRGCDAVTASAFVLTFYCLYLCCYPPLSFSFLFLSPLSSYLLYSVIWLHFIQLRWVFMALWRCFAALLQICKCDTYDTQSSSALPLCLAML